MNTREIEALLDTYYKGEASLEEEKNLSKYFLDEIVPPHLAADADLFRSLKDSQKEVLGDPDFEKKFLAAIGGNEQLSVGPAKKRIIYITSLAAAVVLLTGLFVTLRYERFAGSRNNSSAEATIAYAETQKALLLLSMNFNTGIREAEKLRAFDQGISQVQSFGNFNKGLLEARKFSDFYKYQKIVFNPDEINRPQNP